MDHLKPKMEDQFASSFVGSDLKTPPYAPPLHYHEESVLRSTQAPQGYEPSNVSGLHLHGHVAAKPRRLPDWRSTQSAAVHDASSDANGRARSAAPAVQPPSADVRESKDEILEVDTRFGHDSVYLLNAAVLDQIIMPGNYFVVIGDAKAPKDAEAWCLTCLESLWAGEGMIGALPVPEPASNALCGYHAPLSRAPSMELDGTIARLSNLRVDGSCEDKEALPSSSHDLSNEFTKKMYDTKSIPESLLSSKHAPTPEELAGYPLTFQFPNKLPSPPFEDRPETPGSPYTPSSSQMSSQEATTRFQSLAHYVTGGKSLDDEEQATLALWQKTSIEQVGGGEDPEEFGRAIMKHLREHCAKADDETSEAEKDAAWDEFVGQFDWVEEHRQIDESIFCVLEFVSGLTKGDVAGRDLSDAFADMNTVRKEE
ncbi:hypothetical protein KC316_g17253 [Hortaea werneckii]|nr:hypothetical protein KC324_g17217 [Hortaea werneckii]KAI7531123.1 hypothetical protein KC316_g17253 [Hortaea werneckii]